MQATRAQRERGEGWQRFSPLTLPPLRGGSLPLPQRGEGLVEILAIIVAVVAAFLVLRFVTGLIKFAVLGLIVLAAIYFMGGGLGG